MEILREIYWESKRAPETNTTAIRNPYQKERFIKKFLGKTKEERLATIQQYKEDYQQNILEAEAKELGVQANNDEEESVYQSMRKSRREFASKRMYYDIEKSMKRDDIKHTPIK